MSWGGGQRVRRVLRSPWIAVLTVLSLFAGVNAASAMNAGDAARHASAPGVPRTPSVTGVRALGAHWSKPHDAATKPYRPGETALPTTGTASVSVTRSGTRSTSGRVPVSMTRVVPRHGSYRGPASADVTVRSRAAAGEAGVNGVLFTVTPEGAGSGKARVDLDYSGFAQVYGGGFGSRLRLVELPGCALTTPRRAACRRQKPLASHNDVRAGTVSAPVSLAGGRSAERPATGPLRVASGDRSAGRAHVTATTEPMPTAGTAGTVVLAAVSGASQGDGGGPKGSYAATTLKPSGSWAEGGASGSFTYAYPMDVPPAATGLAPTVGLDYDSGSVDGQTSATQAQSSWVGDGWSTPQSFIERGFASCADDPEGTASPVPSSDECYDGPVLTMSLNGSTTSLVWDSDKKVWKPQDDHGEVVTHHTGTDNGSGTYDTDYWTVTERDGTTYSFGRNELPGWTSGDATTHSVDSVPVYSAHSGDPCYDSSGFSSSVCTMAYRWNMDYVTDSHGNAMSYYYTQDTNYYGEDGGAHEVSYVRDSHLDHIDYGFSDGGAYGTVTDKVVFTTGDRCVSGTCDPLSSSTEADWPDVPYDLVCAKGATCSSHAPAFFSTVRLTAVAAQQYSTAASAYADVDSWALKQTLPVDGDGDATLWLASVTRTGDDTGGGGGTAPALPAVSFTAVDLANRADTVTDGLPPLYRYRIASVTTETGSVIGVQYGQSDPCQAPVTITPSANTSSCYPVYWTPEGYSAPILDWFNKYDVEAVTQTDPTGGAPVTHTSYTYAKLAWHYDDNEVVKAKFRTYGQFRGFQDVKTFTGDGDDDPLTEAETSYYQGMSDDDDSTAVTVTDSQGGTHDDTDQLAGLPLESTSYLGSGGPVDHSTVTSYWVSPSAATRTRSGLADLTARMVEPVESWTRQALTADGTTKWRITETDTAYDTGTSDTDFGLETTGYSHTVPAQAAYDRCTTTGYAAANTDENLVGLPSDVETDSVACGGFTEGATSSVPGSVNTLTAPSSVNRPAQVVSATRTFYDDPAMAATWPQPASPTFPQTGAPTRGDASVVQKASDYTGAAFTWQTSTATVYDTHGRTTATYDADGSETSTAYTDDSAGATTAVETTNALGQSTTTTLDPARGLTLTSTDPNSVVTTAQYDSLGRITGVWKDSRATSSPANVIYHYQVSDTGTTAVTTDTMNDEAGYNPSVEIYDALLRPRQTQTATPKGGRLVTDTFYDTHGWTTATYHAWWDPATGPDTTLVSAADLKDQVPDEDFYSYDGLGRQVVDQSEDDGAPVTGQTTTTVHNGDRTTVIPPVGGITKTTVSDPLGRTSELDEYTAAPTLNPPINPFTGIWTVSGGTSQATTYGFDGHGNQNSVTAGGSAWTSTYDLLGRVTGKDDPDAGSSTMRYDPDGDVLQSTDARGRTISYTYDALGRKTGEYDAATGDQSPGATGNQLASWVYDDSNDVAGVTDPVGRLTTETAYHDGAAYTTQRLGFDVFGESKGERVTIPSVEGALAGSYTFQNAYTTDLGLLDAQRLPAAGGLPLETLTYGYSTPFDLPGGLGGSSPYTQTTSYDAYSRVDQETIGSLGSEAYLTNSWDPHTGDLNDQLVTREVGTPTDVDDQKYTYDPAGDITRQTSTRLGDSSTSETQCYHYDQLDRLTQAWTATDSCAATPTASDHSTVGDSLSSTSAYWTSWSLDTLGNRTSETDHSTTGGADTTTSYTYDGNGASQPDTLTSTSTTGPSGSSATSYGYDADGDTTTRTTPTDGTQTLDWNDAGQLTDITGGDTGDSHFLYDADGNLLIAKDPGATTLYLPDEQLTLHTSTGSITGTRYYDLPGGGTAVRTGTVGGGASTVTFEIADQHDTHGLELDSTAQNPTWRQFTPYGAPRGDPTSWTDNRGFLNAPTDTATGLTIVGARQYDPTTGRFISPDPLLEPTSPQQLNGYSYTEDNPIGQSDPTGLMVFDGGSTGSVSAVEKTDQQAAHNAHVWKVKVASEHRHGYHYSYASQTFVRKPTYNGRTCMRLGISCSGNPRELTGSIPKPLKTIGLSVGVVFLTAADLAQGGLDPVTDTATAADALFDTLESSEADTGSGSADDPSDSDACSFAPATPVLLPGGKTKPIGKIKPGDQVEAGNPKTGKHAGPRRVLATWINHDHDLLDLTITTPHHHPATLHTTSNHPFWDDTTHTWTPAGNLTPGHHLVTATNTHATVMAVTARPGAADRDNLTVEQLHTYYVLAGSTPVLVHNSNGPTCGVGPDELQQTYESANTEAKLEHVVDPAKHGFDNLVQVAGGRSEAMKMIVDSLGDASDLPQAGKFEVDRTIAGEQVTIRGAMVNGVPRIGTAFIPSAFPGNVP